ncbi:kinase-like domain-containing protein [Mycena pura]|uniref:Kinase-like domain-containing protein n=1 Tax=Mycena pura TaxID=153505 RepID=A0AAD6YLY2_9AGAR|nr:kinase-like domain-containing protein [Mycena pura]
MSTESEYDGFMYCELPDYEPPSGYALGGLCPIRLGCELGSPPRYRVIAKLGYGAYSTVWLAHDRVDKRNVALKIVEARTSSSNELDNLQRLQAPDTEEPRVVQLLDAFEHTSPNGRHQVLVMEPVYPIDLFWFKDFRPVITRDALRQTIAALAFIRSRGMAHGDIHPGNFGMAVPEVERFSVVDIWNLTGRPKVQVILHTSHSLGSFPPYLCSKMDLGAFLLSGAPEFMQRPLSMRILDLGNAYVVGECPPRANTPIIYAAPEVAFACTALNDLDATWDQRSDIWSLAVCIYALACYHPIFKFTYSVLHEMMYYCGEVPDAWREYLRSEPFPDGIVPGPAHADGLWKKTEQYFSRCHIENPAGFVRLLRRMMQLDPAKRPTAVELLRDPYFDGLHEHDGGDVPLLRDVSNVVLRAVYLTGLHKARGALRLVDIPKCGEDGDWQSNTVLE